MDIVERGSVTDAQDNQEHTENISTRKITKYGEYANRDGEEMDLRSLSNVQSNVSSKRPESPHILTPLLEHQSTTSTTPKVAAVGDLHQSVH
jgi:hypothetical protein